MNEKNALTKNETIIENNIDKCLKLLNDIELLIKSNCNNEESTKSEILNKINLISKYLDIEKAEALVIDVNDINNSKLFKDFSNEDILNYLKLFFKKDINFYNDINIYNSNQINTNICEFDYIKYNKAYKCLNNYSHPMIQLENLMFDDVKSDNFNFSFNVFSFEEICKNNKYNLLPLEISSYYLMDKIKVFQYNIVDYNTFAKFSKELSNGYLNIPYHNYLHATDVQITSFMLIYDETFKNVCLNI